MAIDGDGDVDDVKGLARLKKIYENETWTSSWWAEGRTGCPFPAVLEL